MSAPYRGQGLCLYCGDVGEGDILAEHQGNSGGGETIICCTDCAKSPKRRSQYAARISGSTATRVWTDPYPN